MRRLDGYFAKCPVSRYRAGRIAALRPSVSVWQGLWAARGPSWGRIERLDPPTRVGYPEGMDITYADQEDPRAAALTYIDLRIEFAKRAGSKAGLEHLEDLRNRFIIDNEEEAR